MTAEDFRKKLEERVREAGKGGLPAGERRALTGGDIGQMAADRAAAQKDAPLYAFIAYDITMSMEPYLNAVRDNVREVGRQLFGNETGINLTVWGVGDHSFDPVLQTNPFVLDYQTLDGQLRAMKITNGGDFPEAYECGFRELAKAASGIKTAHPTSKVAVVFVGDSVPHGMTEFRREFPLGEDDGCPRQVDYKQTLAYLKGATDFFYFVGCSNYPEIITLQKTLINPNGLNEKYIDLGKMVGDLPPLLIGAIKQARSPESLTNYLRTLDSGTSARIQLYLPPPK